MYFNTSTRIFLVTFLFGGSNKKFIINEPIELKNVLQKFDVGGIESIKEFDFKTDKFKRVAKKDVLDWSNYCTETEIYLSKHYYFKK